MATKSVSEPVKAAIEIMAAICATAGFGVIMAVIVG